ncbi:MAG: YqgE/AlgH family protein [Paracoccaceae bacterium]|nr:YqgE/AlgH family protein [Paracoccaceae bacterium]
MDKPQDLPSLTGKLLIAMPGMGDPRFEHGVVYLCTHSEDGAMGLIVNKPAGDLSLRGLLEKLDIRVTSNIRLGPVHFGGPVETGRGFVLHSMDYASNDSTLEVEGGIGMTATLDILSDIAGGRGPSRQLVALGYAGWGPGQLESEIAENGWLTADATHDIVFRADNTEKWRAALAALGVDALSLSSDAGRA